MSTVTALTPVGARLPGYRVGALDESTAHTLRRLLADHGVLVFADQDADDETFLRFLRSFGRMTFTVGETPVDGFPDLNVISNVGRDRPPRSNFHTDTSYVRNPPLYTALRAVQIPERGGHTLFSDQYAAFDDLPDSLRSEIDGQSITHVVTGLELGPDDETSAVHPVIRTHPISHRRYLYLSTPARCADISGVPDARARELVKVLYAHSTRPSNVYRHSWQPGDIVMWDNRAVMHRADHTGVIGNRVLHRGMVV